ncbi:Universal stress protein family protein [Mycobacterium tuberculosis H37Rv] [Mycobacterium shimoidei]|uniref:Universal stress protein family protein [Mycobacterium tuberculosis H37Rv] n=1 Tax=Mycobacterium shimoidei TaxID=29313 RepID=A0A375YZ11_MYCSH|nr:universal stress protein [Mycobacterium shimoidei]SRX94163.1 Universal stress protein family protein [Mycobacterium tuberculosis H37Rv] [Mycobacterium shimoidei]
MEKSPGPVVVGIDGSDAAIKAAEWATKEALHQDVPLRLVHVMQTAHRLQQEYAESALRAACAAVEATGLPVKVDTSAIRGDAGSVLLEESRGASLVCVGSVGIGRVASMLLGSTARKLAEQAHCPVAIIRRDDDATASPGGFIAVVLDDQPGNDEVVRWAMEEARVRRASVLALGVWRWALLGIGYERLYRRLDHWLRRYPDVRVEVAATRTSVTRYLEGQRGAVQLIVIGPEDADKVAELVGPHSVPILAHADCSVLIVRG